MQPDTLHHRIREVRRCALDGCEKPAPYGRICSMHQSRKFKTGTYGPVGSVLRTPVERFWSRVDKSGDCWIWTGARSGKGYGNMSVRQKPVLVHRFSYELANGPIPAGLVVMHSCDNPPCVNPAHLSVGTYADNNHDKNAKGRHAFHIDTATLELVRTMRESGATHAVIAARIGRTVGATKKIWEQLKRPDSSFAHRLGVSVDG